MVPVIWGAGVIGVGAVFSSREALWNHPGSSSFVINLSEGGPSKYFRIFHEKL